MMGIIDILEKKGIIKPSESASIKEEARISGEHLENILLFLLIGLFLCLDEDGTL